MARIDNRKNDQIRDIKITRNYTKYAEGSVLIEMGSTKVICTASIEDKVPPFLRNTGTGWINAEYSMLPRSTTPAKIAMIVVTRIERRTPPRIPLTIKKIAIARPIKPTITVGLLKATKPGVADDEAVIDALAMSAPLPATV